MSEAPRTLAGIGYTLLGGLVFAGSNATAKHLAAFYPAGETLFVRSVIALLLLLPFLRWDDVKALWQPGQRGWQVLRCASSAIEVWCYYWALAWLGLAEISTIYMAGPIYITAMSALFLGEQVGWRRWTAVLVGFAGVVVALNPGAGVLGWPALIAVGGSLLYATSLVATRRLRGTPTQVLVASQVAALALPSAIPIGWVMPQGWDWLALLAVGVVAMAGYLFTNRGVQLAPASVVAPFGYLGIVWAMTLGLMFFGDVPSGSTMIGAAMIVGAGLFIMLRERGLTGGGGAAQAIVTKIEGAAP